MDDFRNIITQITNREQDLLSERMLEYLKLRTRVYWSIGIFSILLAGTYAWIAVSTARENKIKIELEKSQSELHHAREAFNTMVDRVKDYGIFLLDSDGNIVTWNQGAQRMKGYSADEIIGKNFSLFYPEQVRQTDHPQYELKQALECGHYEEEGWRLRKDGSRFWAGITITPIKDDKGTHAGFIKVTRDLTERKTAEEKLKSYAQQLEVARDEALQANALKSAFVANISHEIRTPLSGVVGMAELLALDPHLEGDTLDFALALFESSKQLLVVLNDLLDFSKLEAGRTQIERVPFALGNIIDDVLALSRQKIKQKELVLEVRLDSKLPPTMIGDPGKIRQILLNLVHNAIKFTEKGGIEIAVERQADKLHFSVTDTGVGIPPEIQSILFKPFVQADASTTRKYGGTGLGLSIAKQYTELMGGEMGLFSQADRGSTFWFDVPLTTSDGQDNGQT